MRERTREKRGRERKQKERGKDRERELVERGKEKKERLCKVASWARRTGAVSTT